MKGHTEDVSIGTLLLTKFCSKLLSVYLLIIATQNARHKKLTKRNLKELSKYKNT